MIQSGFGVTDLRAARYKIPRFPWYRLIKFLSALNFPTFSRIAPGQLRTCKNGWRPTNAETISPRGIRPRAVRITLLVDHL